jgi:hypothetical protein
MSAKIRILSRIAVTEYLIIKYDIILFQLLNSNAFINILIQLLKIPDILKSEYMFEDRKENIYHKTLIYKSINEYSDN